MHQAIGSPAKQGHCLLLGCGNRQVRRIPFGHAHCGLQIDHDWDGNFLIGS
jgi:hypothetical protein